MGEGRASPGVLFSSSQMASVPWAFPELPLVLFALPGAAGAEVGPVGDTGEGRDVGMGGEAVGRPGGRNPLGVSGRAALCSHTVPKVLKAWRMHQEEQPRKAQTRVPLQGLLS